MSLSRDLKALGASHYSIHKITRDRKLDTQEKLRLLMELKLEMGFKKKPKEKPKTVRKKRV